MSRQINKFIAPGISVDKIDANSDLDMGNNKITNVANPTAAQDVATKDYVDNTVGGSSSGSAGAIQFSNGSGGFSSDSTNLFWDDANNRLGVGGAPSVNGIVTFHVPSGANTNPFLILSSTSNVLAAIVSNDGSGDGIFSMSKNSETSPEFNVVLRTNGDSHLTGGNVGIGTTTPSTPLEVLRNSGTGWVSLFSDGTNGVLFQTDTNYGGLVGFTPSGYNPLDIRASTDPQIRLTTDGRIGLGTNSPSTKVQIDGGTLDMSSNKIESLADPTSAQDAATKAYVDTVVNALGTWTKYTYSYTDFSTASTTNFLTSPFTLASDELLEMVIVKVTTAFSGGGATSALIYIDPTSGSPLSGTVNSTNAFTIGATSSGLPTSLVLFGTEGFYVSLQSDVDLDQLTAGSFDVYFKKTKLPA